MDETWQLRGENRSSSQWINWQGLTNQVDIGPGRYANPCVTQDICVVERTVRQQEPAFPNILSLNSQSVVHSRAGKPQTPHPMLPVSQENLQQFQAEYQQTAIVRTSYLAASQPWCPINLPDGGGWSPMAPGNPSPAMGKLSAPSNPVMAEYFQGGQGGEMSQFSRTGGPGSAMSRLGSMDLYKQSLPVNSHVGGMGLQPQYQMPFWQSDHRPSMYIEKHTPSLHKFPSQDTLYGLVREQPCKKPLLRPRVLCAGISGYLLGGELTMSETGRLGVICSCHGSHMSVAKFSEHAGLICVNPGSSVLMEGGQSMAEWRKSFFSQFGVKVPEDHVGWEWDERNGAESDTSTREVHVQAIQREADAFLQGDGTALKNKINLHSSVALGSSIFSGGKNAGLGLIHTKPSQERGTVEPILIEKPHNGLMGVALSEDQVISQGKPCNLTNQNQGSNSAHLFWGREPGASDHASFPKVGLTKHGIENSFGGGSLKKVVEQCTGSYAAHQEMGQVEKDSATSNFELRLGQPSQQNLSLGSVYSNVLQSRGACGPVSQPKPATYEMAGQSAWEQTCHQTLDHSAMGRPTTFGGLAGQSIEGSYTNNWFSNNQKNRDFRIPQASQENDKQLSGFHEMNPRPFPDVHTIQMFPSMCREAEEADVRYVDGSYHSDIMMQPPDNRSSGEQRRADLSSSDYSTFTTLNAVQHDSFKQTASEPQSHQSSAPLIRPTVKTIDSTRNVENMFMTHLERPRAVMGPPETMVSASDSSAIKDTMMQAAATVCESTLNSWPRQVSCLTISESLSSCGPTKVQEQANIFAFRKADNVSTQQGLLVQAESHDLAQEVGLSFPGPSTVNTCSNVVDTREGSRDVDNHVLHQETDLTRSNHDAKLISASPSRSCADGDLNSRDEVKSVPHGESMVVGEKGLPETREQVPDETHPGMHPNRASEQQLKCKEALLDPMATNYSSSDKCCLSDEGVTKSDVDAEADSDGVVITTQEVSLPFNKSSTGHELVNTKLEDKRSSRSLCGTVESTPKELVRNDLVDEGSGIGKCCSSIEADMEAMTSAGPALHVQALESQTSIANSSSSNAVISDTLSNSVRARKLLMEVDKSTIATQAEVHYGAAKSIHRNDKRGRKPVKMKCLGVSSFPEEERNDRFAWVEDKSPMGVSRKALMSDDTYWVPTSKGLKRKRSALISGPDMMSSKGNGGFGEETLQSFDEEDHSVKRKGLKVILRPPPDEKISKLTATEPNHFSKERAPCKSKRARFSELNTSFSNNACRALKSSIASGSEKAKSTILSSSNIRSGRGGADWHDSKAVKTASLSSILHVPKAGTGFQRKRATDTKSDMLFDLSQSKIPQSRLRQVKGWAAGGTRGLSAHCNRGLDNHSLTKLEGQKRSSWEMGARVVSHATGVPAGCAVDAKLARLGFRQNLQNSQDSVFERTMITVPLKFIAAKRLAPEVLREETKDLSLSSADWGNLFMVPMKRLRSHATPSKTPPFSPMPHQEDKGFVSTNNEEDEPVRKRSCKKRSKLTLKPKLKQSLVCCICGDVSSQSNNMIVKCSRCSLGVHQACYGVTEVSKKPWTCRPCKVHATNIVCVLCGYGDGAMTRAKRSEVLAKGLHQAWQSKKDVERPSFGHCIGKTAVDNEQSDNNTCQCDSTNGNTNCKLHRLLKRDEGGADRLVQEDCNGGRNSVVDGINDPMVTQWVHVVCALWMPGTRCTNVKTMAAFDVSGVGSAPRKWVCSICKRPGGACIKCRVPKCATPFHPWCAHGKGLLQNEAFGGAEEKVGFFGKCLLHGSLRDESEAVASVAETPVTETPVTEAPVTELAIDESQDGSSTCARTEGGYKRGETSFGKKVIDPTSLGILHEDVATWLSIKENRRSTRRVVKLASLDVRTHHREYVRYKQGQSWKRLAVYKSSIHALGLYTSEFIAKGEMVVEYVGEIVGLRVADKREAAYLSNGRLQYRSACYLFRIDEEHIIDATHKGGIARFVNHSCCPNCVAKIISVEKQKKVVFFAEKDIAAGEELTYDYKLDFETENRIPCYCKSTDCRGFLN